MVRAGRARWRHWTRHYHVPVILDMVNDNVQLRSLSALTIACILLYSFSIYYFLTMQPNAGQVSLGSVLFVFVLPFLPFLTANGTMKTNAKHVKWLGVAVCMAGGTMRRVGGILMSHSFCGV